MGVRRVLGSSLALLALALIAPAAAAADEMLQPRGALIYSWHGDRTRGCAAMGVCGVQGTLTVRPQDPVFFFAPPPTPRNGELDLTGAQATVRVRRTDAGSSGDCVDTYVWPNVGDATLDVQWQRDGRAQAMIPQGDGPSAGRCAGPLAHDLPPELQGRRLRGRALRLRFSSTQAFVAGPYSGTLVSTLAFGPDTNGGESPSSSTGVPDTVSPPTRRVLDERVMITLRADSLPGSILAALRGAPDSFCLAVDSCATSGALSFHFSHGRGRLTFVAERYVRHRVGRRQALADFRAGRLRFGLPFPGIQEEFSVGESLARAGDLTCTDKAGIEPTAMVWLGSPFTNAFGTSSASGVPVVMTLGSGPNDFVRTYCQGPASTDVFGVNLQLATATVSAGELLKRHLTLVLRPAHGFSSGGYVGSMSGAITLKLSQLKLAAGTIKVPA